MGITRREFIIGAAATAGALGLAGCAQSHPITNSTSGVPKRGGTLIVAISSDITGLDPQLNRATINTTVEQQMYEPPYRIVPSSTDLQPAQATKIDISADGLEYTIHFRQGLKFHDGTAMDANAWVFAMKRQAFKDNPYHQGGAFPFWANITGGYPGHITSIDAADSLTAQLKLDQPIVNLLSYLADITTVPISPAVIKSDPARWGKRPIGAGSGPFVFEEWAPGQHISFKRFPDYWESGKPYVDRLIIQPMVDPGSRVLALKAGALHVSPVQGPELKDLESDPSIQIIKGPPGPLSLLGFDHTDPAFSKLQVRQAVAHALDRKTLVSLWPGTAKVAENVGIFPGEQGYDSSIHWYPYDPAAAKKLLADAGYSDGYSFTFTLAQEIGFAPDNQAVAEAIQSMLAKVGLRAKIQVVDVATFNKYFFGPQGNKNYPYQMALLGAGNRGDAQTLLSVWNFLTNYGGYHPAYGDLVAAASKTVDTSKRIDVWKQAQQMLYRDCGFVPIANTQTVIAASTKVHGLKAPFSEWPINYSEAWLS